MRRIKLWIKNKLITFLGIDELEKAIWRNQMISKVALNRQGSYLEKQISEIRDRGKDKEEEEYTPWKKQ